MAACKLEVDVEVNCSADKYWEMISDSNNIFTKVFPDQYKSIKVLEGDGQSVGSVRHITYGEGSPLVKESEEKVDIVDEAGKRVSYSVIGGDLLEYYKNFKATLVITPKGEGSLVKWSCECEKASEEIPDPNIIKEFAVKNLLELADYAHKQMQA